MPNPVIFTAGPFALRWYGFFAALAALTGYFIMISRSKRHGFTTQQTTDMLVLCVLCGVVGARLEFVRRFWGEFFADDPMAIFRVWEGGLVFQGGFILAAIGVIIMCWRRHLSIGAAADLVAPALPAAHAVARWGCLFNGCCFGRIWEGFGAIQYPAHANQVMLIQQRQGLLPMDAAQPATVLPVQLLESVWCLALALLLFYFEKRKLLERRRFIVYVLLYSVGRFAIEFFRGDYLHPGVMTPAQWTTLVVIIPALVLWLVGVTLWQKRQARKVG